MATSTDDAGFSRAEESYKNFISDPERLAAVCTALASLPSDDKDDKGTNAVRELRHGLNGWQALIECNVVESDAARVLMSELIKLESDLFAKQREHVLQHVNEAGELEDASLGILATNLSTNRVEAARKSSHDALMSVELWMLVNGFLDIVKKRNAFARAQGFANYFDYKVQKNEQMLSAQLFKILDDFEARTRDANLRGVNDLTHKYGAGATLPQNIRFRMSGDVTRQLDPYLSFGKGLQRWVQSVRNLGIAYRGATMQLDLMERKGKYQNGFCHVRSPRFLTTRANGCPVKSTSRPALSPTKSAAAHAPLPRCFTKAATPLTSPTSRKIRRAFRKNSRQPQWPTPKRNRCFATACSTTPTGSSATRGTLRARRFPTN